MHLNLNSGLRKLIFATACLAAVGVYTFVVGRHYLATRSGAKPDPASLERAVKLEPWNAESRAQLGRYSLFVTQDATGAVTNLEAALALNPHVARYWLDLAAAYQVAGDTRQQRSALEGALHAEPTDPEVAWEAGNFYLVANDLSRALSLFRVVMANDPDQLSSALSLCWRATGNVNKMLAEAVPSEPAAYLAFIGLLTSKGQTAPAETVWAHLTGLGQPFPAADAFPYFDYLIQKHDTAAAVQVWKELLRGHVKLHPYIERGNLIVDGGLEKDFLNGGFDWRYAVSDPVELAVDTSEFHGGNQSVRMTFKGPGVAEGGLFEYVPVQPNTNYRFSAYTKAEEIESASGPRVSVADAYTGHSYVLTYDSLGTTGWRQQSADFRTNPETTMLIVRVARVPSDPLIKGKFWIDDVSLVLR